MCWWTPTKGQLGERFNVSKEIALKFLQVLGKGDVAAAASCIGEDGIAVAKGFGSLSGARNHDVTLTTVGAFKQLMPEGLNPSINSVTAEHDRVVVEFEGKGWLFNGEPYGNQYCMVFALRDGRIRQIHEYFCTLLADQVLGPLMSGSSA